MRANIETSGRGDEGVRASEDDVINALLGDAVVAMRREEVEESGLDLR